MASRPLRWFLAVLLLLLAPLAVAAGAGRSDPRPDPRPAATAGTADLYVFWRQGCPHCEKELAYLDTLRANAPGLRVHTLELGADARHRALYARVAEALNIPDPGVPLTVLGAHYLVGYDADATSGLALQMLVRECLAHACPDVVGALAEARAPPVHQAAPRALLPERLRMPLLGEVDTRSVSLPALTVFLAALDGFNPCAMWVLVFLIGLLGGLRDRTRMWLLGGAFIVASAGVYYLFMAAWLSLLLFIGAVVWVRLLIGAVALLGGAYYLREYFANPAAVCRVTAPERRRRVFAGLKAVASEQSFWLALAGIVALAFAVNLVELFCSAGIPAVYTQVLALSELPAWQYHAYLGLYLLVFMLDDLLVFGAAMWALEAVGFGGRYLRASHLVGGVVLIAIGLLLLLRPQWLAFG